MYPFFISSHVKYIILPANYSNLIYMFHAVHYSLLTWVLGTVLRLRELTIPEVG